MARDFIKYFLLWIISVSIFFIFSEEIVALIFQESQNVDVWAMTNIVGISSLTLIFLFLIIYNFITNRNSKE